MRSQDLEFSISQYVDGTLDSSERAALEARLAADADAQTLLDEERALVGALRDLPLPPIEWNRLTEVISAAVAQAEEPVQSYRLWRSWMPVPLGLAASLLIAAGLAIHMYSAAPSAPPRHVPPVVQQVAVVTGPQADAPEGPVQVEVSIGPGNSVAGGEDLSRYSDDVVTRPSRVLVASGVNSVDDAPSFPY